MNPALTEPTSPNSDPSADDPANAPAAEDADPPNGDDEDDDEDDDDEAASPAHSEPPLAKAVSDSIEKKKRKRGGDGGDAKGEEEKTADAKGDPDEAGDGRSKALKRDESASASAPAAAAQTAPSFGMPPITIDPGTGKASIEINVKGNEGRVIGKGGETVKHIERKFAVKIEMRRERGTCVVTGAEAVLRDAAAVISEVIERGDVNKGDRASAGSIPGGGGGFGVPQVDGPGTMIAKLLASARAKIDSGEDASAADFPEVLRGDDMEEHVAIEVPCPGQEGRVIGRGGATIKEIERQSGASAKVVKGTGRCDVSGPRGRVILARRIVLETMALPVDPFGAGAPGKREAGDWNCPQCNASCFRSKTSCFNCGAPKPAMAYGQPQQMGYGQPQQTGYGMQQQQQQGYGMQQQGYGMQQPMVAGSPMMGGGYGGGGGGAKTSVEVPCMGSEGRIIGKGGDMIKYIQNSTGTKLDMRRDKGTVQVTGTPEAVAAAEAMIREVIENGDTRDKGGLQPPQNLGQPVMGGGQGHYAQPVGGGQVMGGGYAMAPPGQVQMVAVPVQGGYVQAGQPMAQGQYGQPMMMAVPAQQGQVQYQYQPAPVPQGQYAYVDASQVQGAVYVPQQQTAAQQPGAQAVAGAVWGQQAQQQPQQQQEAAPAGGEWQTHYSEGRAYYYNTATGETRWA